MSDFKKVGTTSSFPKNMTTGVKVDGLNICIANENGHFYAFDNLCTHAAAPLADCDIEDGEVTCPLHGARFAVATGEARCLPAVEPLKTYDVKVEGEDVLVRTK